MTRRLSYHITLGLIVAAIPAVATAAENSRHGGVQAGQAVHEAHRRLPATQGSQTWNRGDQDLGSAVAVPSDSSLNWQSPAREDHWIGGTDGTLSIDSSGVEFKPEKGSPHRWTFLDIRILDLRPRRLIITEYEDRGRLRPGYRRHRFDLKAEMPPRVAAELAQRFGRPVKNGNPDPGITASGSMPARHRTLWGGTNGTLRFHDEGISYLSQAGEDSRSWRWTDIQTLSNPDPYHLLVFGYLETYSFELKEPMTRDLYDRLSEMIYEHSPFNSSRAVEAYP
jgi:hypothetical protein